MKLKNDFLLIRPVKHSNDSAKLHKFGLYSNIQSIFTHNSLITLHTIGRNTIYLQNYINYLHQY